MSRNYFVDVTLAVKFSDEMIRNILTNGSAVGLVYYDHLIENARFNFPVISTEEAIKKILERRNLPLEDRALYVELGSGHFCYFWFYESDLNFLEYRLSVFSYPKETLFKDGEVKLDLGFYIHIALKLGEEWGIEKLIADSF